MSDLLIKGMEMPETCDVCPIRLACLTCGCDLDHCMIEEYSIRWIPVKKRLPDDYGEYLVLWKPRNNCRVPDWKLFYEIAEYKPGEGWISDIPQSAPRGGYEVCYWMNLPPEPRKDSK